MNPTDAIQYLLYPSANTSSILQSCSDCLSNWCFILPQHNQSNFKRSIWKQPTMSKFWASGIDSSCSSSNSSNSNIFSEGKIQDTDGNDGQSHQMMDHTPDADWELSRSLFAPLNRNKAHHRRYRAPAAQSELYAWMVGIDIYPCRREISWFMPVTSPNQENSGRFKTFQSTSQKAATLTSWPFNRSIMKKYDTAFIERSVSIRSSAGMRFKIASISMIKPTRLESYKYTGPHWIPDLLEWAFATPRESSEVQDNWSRIPYEIDVLITHGPPLGRGDQIFDRRRRSRVGCTNLLREVQKRVKPHLHVFGHVHEGFGCTSDG